MQDAELFAQRLADNEQRFDQDGQIRDVCHKLPDPRLKPGRPHHANLEPEVAQRGAQVVVDGDGLRLQQLAVRQQHPQLLTS